MNETSKSLGRTFGVPFWMGYVVSLVGWFMLLAGRHILDGHLGFWMNVGVAFGVVAPFGGVIFQATHDLFWAGWRGRFRFWHFALLLAIGVASLVAGYLKQRHGGWFYAVVSLVDDSMKAKLLARIAIAALLMLVLVAALAALSLRGKREPSYQGRSLSQWLKIYTLAGQRQLPWEQRAPAVVAIRIRQQYRQQRHAA